MANFIIEYFDMQTRFTLYRRWFRKPLMVLQIKINDVWHDAGEQYLDILNRRYSEYTDNSPLPRNGFFPVGIRVYVNQDAGFSRGSYGEVVFQEPHEGKVWVLREGASQPCYFYGKELDYGEETFTRPTLRTEFVDGITIARWLILSGHNRVSFTDAEKFCIENGIEDYNIVQHDYHFEETPQSVKQARFDTQTDAMLFYMRFR